MHDLATKFSTSTKNFPSAPSDDLLTPISISNRASDSFAWPQHLDYSIEANLDNWPLTTPTNATPRKSTSVNYYSTNMPLRTDLSDRWDLSDDLARLNITDVSNKEPQLHTPPKSQYTSAAVASLNDASPLAETSSSVSIGSSPHTPEHDISISHSRGSSTDTTHSSVRSVKNSVLLAKPPLKVNTGNDIKERPHSFSGGLSSADLRRLQLAGEGPEATDRQQLRNQRDAMGSSEQLTYPSLTNNVIHRPQPQPYSQAAYEFRGSALTQQASDDLPDFAAQRNNFASLPQAPLGGPLPGPTAFVQGRPGNAMTTTFRQPPRAFPQQGPAPMGYTHAPHLSMGNSQQLYDMMLPGAHPDHPAVTRVQQQHNVYRPTHHHSNSDPSAAIRDVASMGMMGNNALPPFAPGMYQTAVPTIPMYPNQFYPGQEYSLPADAAVMAARLQPQYSGQYPVVPAPASVASDVQSNGSGGANNGPSANNRKLGLYKTELCRSWEEKGSCRYGAKCQFAHGEDELRKVSRHPKYKTEICRTFWVSGTCPYGKRCCFIHTELPNSGGTTASGGAATPTADTAPQPRTDGRARSMSTNSDPTEAPVSLLARIGKRAPESQQATPTEANSFQQIGRPGSLRLDTNVDNSAVKENKSAYPSFVSNPMLMSMPDRGGQKSPAPVTAGPDLGRHNAAARREIVGYNIRTHKPTSSASSIRHSLQSSEDLGINPSPIPSYSSINPGEGTRASGHIRSGSAGNWGSFSRSSHLQSPFPQQTSSPAGEIMATSPWPSTDLSGSTRINEKVWA